MSEELGDYKFLKHFNSFIAIILSELDIIEFHICARTGGGDKNLSTFILRALLYNALFYACV